MSLGGSSFNGDTKYSVKSPREQDGEAAHRGTGDVRGGGSGHTREVDAESGCGAEGEQSMDETCTLSRSEG